VTVPATIAIDVGGTSMKGALVGADGSVLAAGTRPTAVARADAARAGDQGAGGAGAGGGGAGGGGAGGEGAGGGDAVDGGAVLAAILAYAEELAARAQELTNRPPVAAGLVVPGVLDEARGVVEFATNLGWRGVPLRAEASRRLRLPVVIGHDVRSAAVAESRFGAAVGQRDFLYLSIGTGIAGALFTGGRPYAGATARGGELGHVPVGGVVPGAPPQECRCGQVGCLEAYASASAILRRYESRGGEPGLSTPEVVRRAAGHPAADPAAGGQAADPAAGDPVAGGPVAHLVAGDPVAGGPVARPVAGDPAWGQVAADPVAADPVAAAVWGEAVTALATTLAWYTLVLDPVLVVIGGGLAEAGDALFDPLRAELAAMLAWREPPQVLPGALGQSAGCLGAAILAWRTVGRELTSLAGGGP
jgi:glucokinase